MAPWSKALFAVAAIGAMSAIPATSSANAIKDEYTIKLASSTFAPASFTVKINGEEIGNYDTNGQTDVTEFFKPGKNKIVVTYTALSPISNQFAETILTLGRKRNGKWSSVMKVTARKASPKGTRTLTIIVK